ncbi:S66 peptidase family protein [Pedobacter duraquae]|uniref:Muramoyltetrapeptide carboxypeptidase n=1 Tax=Pedobacter duraquae TaxID=425511 RepID=A0A4V3C2V3_9SPHI|nr:LD-carboxypeptidase [Pedobacter duraquae]TDO19299.1 muramoyltetrapeptide carboxypeptidase [Pedobacter duraquae]
MIQQPPHLKKGDKLAIVCPAKKLPKRIDDAVALLQEWGLEVIIGESVYASENQFAGSDALRALDLQRFLDDPEIKAIIAGRGGYGTIRIIDELDFTVFNAFPKWIIGFSDITVLLSHLLGENNTMSIHGQMPYTFSDASNESLLSLHNALFGKPNIYKIPPSPLNIPGNTEGVLIGGNLTLLVMLSGSVSEMDYTDKILFLEDVGEQESSIDRMMRMLKRSGKLARLKGLIVGALNEIETETIPFGETPQEIIHNLVKEYGFPICFDFPIGHIDDNRAVILGQHVALQVSAEGVTFQS